MAQDKPELPDPNDNQIEEPEQLPTPAELFQWLFAWLAALPHALARLWERFAARIKRIGPRTRTVLREHRARNFPESNRLLVRWFLLLGGLFPMWRSLLSERLAFLRRFRLHHGASRASRTPAPIRAKRLAPLLFVFAAIAASSVGVFASLYTHGTTVSYKGKELDVVESTAAAQRVAAQVERITAETLGDGFRFDEDSLQYSESLVARSSLNGDEELEKDLTDEIGLVTYGYSLYVDGELIGSTEYKGALEALLGQIGQIYTSADTLSIDFVENVEITEGYIPTERLVNLGRIAEVLNSTKTGAVTYTVVKGDTWGKIAYDNGMSNSELLELNPGYDINRINIGDELLISNAVPYLTVIVTERQNYVAEVDYNIEYQDDSSMYQGDSRVISKGAYGTADVVAEVRYVNGVETEREIISSVTLTEPVTELRARGTKVRPSWYPTGSFRWPASGRVTSGFGYRNTGIRGASTYHRGIDIACSYGSPIYAADGGTVIFTGYKAAMGYTVIIDHGNGYVTYYEHCSSFTVSSGQHVYKGQQIAKVGTSGVTSGAHCHFGIQKNGTFVNPRSYLP